MTRQEFLDTITDWCDLVGWCSDNNCDLLSEVYDQDGYDEYINDDLERWAGDETWQDLRERLRHLPDGYDYYRHDPDYDEWRGLTEDDEFYDMLYRVLDWGIDNAIIDDDEEEEPEEFSAVEENTEAEEELELEEDVSFGELFSANSADIQRIAYERDKAEKEADAETEKEFCGYMLSMKGR